MSTVRDAILEFHGLSLEKSKRQCAHQRELMASIEDKPLLVRDHYMNMVAHYKLEATKFRHTWIPQIGGEKMFLTEFADLYEAEAQYYCEQIVAKFNGLGDQYPHNDVYSIIHQAHNIYDSEHKRYCEEKHGGNRMLNRVRRGVDIAGVTITGVIGEI